VKCYQIQVSCHQNMAFIWANPTILLVLLFFCMRGLSLNIHNIVQISEKDLIIYDICFTDFDNSICAKNLKEWRNGTTAMDVKLQEWIQIVEIKRHPTSLQEIASCYLALYFDSKCIEMLCIAFFWTVKVYVSFVWWNANDGQWTPALFFLFFLIQHWWRVLVQLRHWYLLISDM